LDASPAQAQVWFDRLPGTVLLAYESQINVIAPFGLQAGSQVNVQVWHAGIPSAKIPMRVAAAAPALFTRDGSGRGPVAVINQNGGINTPSSPGSVITLFGTGGGLSPGVKDGRLARSAEELSETVRITIGGRDVKVLYAGTAPQLPYGVFQVNAQLPQDLGAGAASVVVTVSGVESPAGVTLEIR
jgi:uncharacterized protein (TIGR03437 family)